MGHAKLGKQTFGSCFFDKKIVYFKTHINFKLYPVKYRRLKMEDRVYAINLKKNKATNRFRYFFEIRDSFFLTNKKLQKVKLILGNCLNFFGDGVFLRQLFRL